MRQGGKLAVIDLGTNTFHLLVVEAHAGQWRELHRERIFVNLAEDGIQQIGSAAWTRASHALMRFKEQINLLGVNETRAVGTAAMRRASNSPEFVQYASSEIGISIRVIDGEMEANYIKWGVESAMHGSPDANIDMCIMDIGGGSVEFCLSAAGDIVYTASFPIGVAVLYDMFHQTEPITDEEIFAIDTHLDTTLEGLKEVLDHFGQTHLVGASGSFEILDPSLPELLANSPYVRFDPRIFMNLYDSVIKLDLEQRLVYPGIPKSRARYLICAIRLIRYAIAQLGMKTIGVSRYALKEGIVHEWMKF